MAGKSEASRDAIISAALTVVRDKGAVGLTIEQVARHAGCAKGLVHYHLKTKQDLLEAVANRLLDERTAAWSGAFRAPSPNDAIAATWGVLRRESDNGTVRAWISLLGSGSLTDQTARTVVGRFTGSLGEAAMGLLEHLGLRLTIGQAELGWLLGSVVEGMGLELLAGGNQAQMEEAYAAAWLGVLSLTRETR